MTHDHPFRPQRPRNSSTRSTETPMDFVYEKPSSIHSFLTASNKRTSSIKPLKVIDQNGDKKLSGQSNPSSKISSWFSLSENSSQPSRKRTHLESESMDWETSSPTNNISTVENQNLLPDIDHNLSHQNSNSSLKSSFQIPDQLPCPPSFVVPTSSSSNLNSIHLSSVTNLKPESFGLKAQKRSNLATETLTDNEQDSSFDQFDVSLDDTRISSKPPFTNNIKQQDRRRRRKHPLRSKLSELTVESDDGNTDGEDPGEQRALIKPKLAKNRSNNSKSNLSTTNNFLTINRWKSDEDDSPSNGKSNLSTETPYILLVYLQLLFNSSLVFVVLYLAINLILMIRTDINHKVMIHSNTLRQEIELCTKEYHINRCFPVELRTPFIAKHCQEWETCMMRDPKLISRSKIGAETFAEIINGFVDVISWKTMLFIFMSIGAGVYATNLAMNNYKAKWEPHSRPISFAPMYPSKAEQSSEFSNHDKDPLMGSSQRDQTPHRKGRGK
ncbi:hypothetical protein O181_026835 [Austropuccinia psidii MF-1]|uniref:Brl1/Brr6 domain-containing protein n=1 Tax=Austropuccinia psidii MF-1 TaxID=1389203 RepID=A0A9Q3H2K5_9BASI|nr:hypothetical protein [Austropuccinia psidii MF-1]